MPVLRPIDALAKFTARSSTTSTPTEMKDPNDTPSTDRLESNHGSCGDRFTHHNRGLDPGPPKVTDLKDGRWTVFSTDGNGHQIDVDLSVLAGGFAPRTLVAVGRPQGGLGPRHQQVWAAVLQTVIRAVADQTSSATLGSLGAYSAYDLTLHQLAISHRQGDDGVLGDVFEYAVMAAVNAHDPQVLELLQCTLAMLGEQGDITGAVTAAAENGRARTAAPTLPMGTTLLTGRRGRPPNVQRLLTQANTRDWKSDIFLCTDRGVLGATIKSNAAHMGRHLRQCLNLPHPPRLGIVPARAWEAGIVFDPTTGIPVVRLPIDVPYFSLLSSTLSSVQAAFARRLGPPVPLHDPTGIGLVMHKWRNWTVGEFIDRLAEEARAAADLFDLTTPVQTSDLTGSETFGHGALVVADPLLLGESTRDPWMMMERQMHPPFRRSPFGFSLP